MLPGPEGLPRPIDSGVSEPVREYGFSAKRRAPQAARARLTLPPSFGGSAKDYACGKSAIFLLALGKAQKAHANKVCADEVPHAAPEVR